MRCKLAQGPNLFRIPQSDGDVVYVGAGGACEDQTACGFERMIRIVVIQHRPVIQTGRIQSRQSIPIRVTAGSIGRSICSVGSNADDRGTPDTGQLLRGGQRQFLISSAETGAVQMHHRFAACEQRQLLASGRLTS